MDRAIKSGRRPLIGNVELVGEWLKPVKYYRQDAFHRYQLFIRLTDGTVTPTDPAGNEQLEKGAVWNPEHVEDQIVNHYAGRPNIRVKSPALKDF